jgi:hypothetical protein
MSAEAASLEARRTACVLLVHDLGGPRDELAAVAGAFAAFEFDAVAVDPFAGNSGSNVEAASVVASLLAELSTDYPDVYVLAVGRASAPALRAISGRRAESVRAAALIAPEQLTGRWPASVRASALPKLLVVGSDNTAATRRVEALERKLIGPRLSVRVPSTYEGASLLGDQWGGIIVEHASVFFNRNRTTGPFAS